MKVNPFPSRSKTDSKAYRGLTSKHHRYIWPETVDLYNTYWFKFTRNDRLGNTEIFFFFSQVAQQVRNIVFPKQAYEFISIKWKLMDAFSTNLFHDHQYS